MSILRPITASKVWYLIALVVALCPLVLPPYTIPFGFSFFFAWVALCVATVLADRPLQWAILCVTPMALVSWDWLQGPREDEFGFYPWSEIALFFGMALAVGATGALFVVRTAMRSGANGS